MDITVKNVSKSFGEKVVLRDLSITFPEGQLSCLMGESGCGKTTLLRILLGLERADAGSVTGMQGKRVSAVFQEDRLCESFSALDNVRMVCKKGVKNEQIEAQLMQVGLSGKSVRQKALELSGGMKRRVAVVRAMMAQRDIVILDEPLKGLDEHTKKQVAEYILQSANGATVIMVTHDKDEVDLMGGRLYRL